MELSRTRRGIVALVGIFALPAFGQSQPPLRAILPVGPGSGVDTITRSVAPSLTKALNGQPVVVENLPGAGGVTGTQAIVKAAPDGTTIGIVSNNHVINPSVYKKLPFDSINDITPISVIGSSPMVLVNPNKLPVKDAKELVAALKARPGYLVEGWFAVVGPAKLPPAQVQRLHDAVVAAFAMPEAQEAMARQGNVIAPTTPEAALAYFRSEQAKYAKLVDKSGIKLE